MKIVIKFSFLAVLVLKPVSDLIDFRAVFYYLFWFHVIPTKFETESSFVYERAYSRGISKEAENGGNEEDFLQILLCFEIRGILLVNSDITWFEIANFRL